MADLLLHLTQQTRGDANEAQDWVISAASQDEENDEAAITSLPPPSLIAPTDFE